jgi:hypothetical protein
MMQVFVISVQNAVPRSAIGSATALTQFSRSIGATVGVTIMGVIVNQGLPASVRGGSTDVSLRRLPPPLRLALAHALHPAFLAAACVAGLVFVVALLGIEDVPLRRSVDELTAAELDAGAPDTGGAVRAR